MVWSSFNFFLFGVDIMKAKENPENIFKWHKLGHVSGSTSIKSWGWGKKTFREAEKWKDLSFWHFYAKIIKCGLISTQLPLCWGENRGRKYFGANAPCGAATGSCQWLSALLQVKYGDKLCCVLSLRLTHRSSRSCNMLHNFETLQKLYVGHCWRSPTLSEIVDISWMHLVKKGIST